VKTASRAALPAEAQPLTVSDVAKQFKVTPSAVTRWIQSGKLHAIKPGRRYYVSVAEVRDFLAGGTA
jgi:excisionase family DNA binding protein